VQDWENRLAPLCTLIEEEVPPAYLWERILAALPEQTAVPDPYMLETHKTARDTAALIASRGAWRKAAIAVSLTACTVLAACTALLVARPDLLPHPPSQTSYIAALIVRVDLASGKVFIRPVAVETPPGRDLELWYINYGKAPADMGVLAKEPETKKIPLGASLDRASFAVTVEPQGGSVDGKPSGPVVYSGELIQD
jgi:anti-sigma-K factor RskA